MRKLCLVMVIAALLSGCSQKSFEVRNAPCGAEDTPAPGMISMDATDEMSAPVMRAENGDRLYVADDYEVTVQTIPGGDINRTIKSCTGFDRARLTVVETEKDGLKRYDCAWSSAGEGAQAVGRMTVLDDGNYHYVLTVMASGDWEEEVSAAWQQLSDSFRINIAQ